MLTRLHICQSDGENVKLICISLLLLIKVSIFNVHRFKINFIFGCTGSSLLCSGFPLVFGGPGRPPLRRLLTAVAAQVAEHRL